MQKIKKIIFFLLILIVIVIASEPKPLLNLFNADYKAVGVCIQKAQAEAAKTGMKVAGAESQCAMQVAREVYARDPKTAVEICLKYRGATWGYKAETYCKADLAEGQAPMAAEKSYAPNSYEGNKALDGAHPKIPTQKTEAAVGTTDKKTTLEGFTVAKKISVADDVSTRMGNEVAYGPYTETTAWDLMTGNKKVVSEFKDMTYTKFEIYGAENVDILNCRQFKAHPDWKLQCGKESMPMSDDIRKNIAQLGRGVEANGTQKAKPMEVLGYTTTCYSNFAGTLFIDCYYENQALLELYQEGGNGYKSEAVDLKISKPDTKIFEIPDYQKI